jgi:hypothetical protein
MGICRSSERESPRAKNLSRNNDEEERGGGAREEQAGAGSRR